MEMIFSISGHHNLQSIPGSPYHYLVQPLGASEGGRVVSNSATEGVSYSLHSSDLNWTETRISKK